MHKRRLQKIVFFTAVIAALYFAAIFTGGEKSSSSNIRNEHPINWKGLQKISISNSKEQIDLEKGADGTWVLPSKSGYRGDSKVITSFLLKVMDVQGAQKVQISDSGLESLGLKEGADVEGSGQVSLYYSDNKLAAKIFIGSLRKQRGKSMEDTLKLRGQYVRFEQSDSVYLIPTPIVLEVEDDHWLDSEIVNVSSQSVLRVSVKSLDDKERAQILVRRDENPFRVVSAGSDARGFSLVGEKPEGQDVEQASVQQLVSALEDLSARNVFKVDDEIVKEVRFDTEADFELLDGSRIVLTFGKSTEEDKAEKKYVKVRREISPELVTEIKELGENSAITVSKSEEPSPPKEVADKANLPKKDVLEDESEGIKPDSKVIPKEPSYISEEEVSKFNAALSPWVFELPDFAADKFLKDRAAYFKQVSEVPASKHPGKISNRD